VTHFCECLSCLHIFHGVAWHGNLKLHKSCELGDCFAALSGQIIHKSAATRRDKSWSVLFCTCVQFFIARPPSSGDTQLLLQLKLILPCRRVSVAPLFSAYQPKIQNKQPRNSRLSPQTRQIKNRNVGGNAAKWNCLWNNQEAYFARISFGNAAPFWVCVCM